MYYCWCRLVLLSHITTISMYSTYLSQCECYRTVRTQFCMNVASQLLSAKWVQSSNEMLQKKAVDILYMADKAGWTWTHGIHDLYIRDIYCNMTCSNQMTNHILRCPIILAHKSATVARGGSGLQHKRLRYILHLLQIQCTIPNVVSHSFGTFPPVAFHYNLPDRYFA